jgi:hypothetical protein
MGSSPRHARLRRKYAAADIVSDRSGNDEAIGKKDRSDRNPAPRWKSGVRTTRSIPARISPKKPVGFRPSSVSCSREGIFILPAARFALTADEAAEMAACSAIDSEDGVSGDEAPNTNAADEETVGDGEEGPAPWERGHRGSPGDDIRPGA